MPRFMLLAAVSALLLSPADLSARGHRHVWYAPPSPVVSPPVAASGSGFSYRAFSHQTPENRPIAVRRAPYSIESNVWRADRKMLQTYWYRD